MDKAKWKGFFLLWAVGLGVFAADQISKHMLISQVPLYTRIEIIPGFFNIVHVRNTGVAFSLFANASGASYVLGSVALIAVVILNVIVFRLKESSLLDVLPFGLILGGAMGNLTDRIRFGAVVDFLDFYIANYHWPAFNVADSAITCGAILMAVRLLLDQKKGIS